MDVSLGDISQAAITVTGGGLEPDCRLGGGGTGYSDMSDCVSTRGKTYKVIDSFDKKAVEELQP